VGATKDSYGEFEKKVKNAQFFENNVSVEDVIQSINYFALVEVQKDFEKEIDNCDPDLLQAT